MNALWSRGAAEADRLSLLLADAADRGETVPCASGDGWLSEDPAERLDAAQECGRCPFTGQCLALAVAAGVTHGVWGGKDFGRQGRAER